MTVHTQCMRMRDLGIDIANEFNAGSCTDLREVTARDLDLQVACRHCNIAPRPLGLQSENTKRRLPVSSISGM